MKKKKIAFVYDAIFPYTKGGGEKRYFEIGKGLTKKGHEIHFYGMKFWEGEKVIKKDGMYYHGICSENLLYNQDGKRSMKQAIFFGFNCIKLIKEEFDIIDCCSFPYFSLFTCKIVSMLKNKTVFATWLEVWGRDYWIKYIGLKGYFGYFIEKVAVLMPDKIISISEHTTKLLKDRLKSEKPIYTIINGVYQNQINKIPPAKEEYDIIFAGRLISHKNIDLLIKSIELVKRKKPDIKVLIIGDGPERGNLENLVLKLNLKSIIRFIGFIEDNNLVYAYIKSSKVFVLPSIREGFGIVAIEANACGTPVITVNHPENAAKDLIKEGLNGFICSLDKEEIAKKIIEILDEGQDKIMEKACFEFSAGYDWERITDNIEKIYLD